jgi:hypothetical protein
LFNYGDAERGLRHFDPWIDQMPCRSGVSRCNERKNMSDKTSLYPVSQVIAKVIRNSGYTPFGFLLATGHSDAESVLPGLESWLENGEGAAAIIATIAAYDHDQSAALHKAVDETAAMKEAGVDPVAYENERIEKIERDRFKPFIFADGELRVPTQISLFAVTVGHEAWQTVLVPAAILSLPLEEQLARLPELMEQYRQKHNGTCPFFGKLVGFKFVRYSDYFQFSADGQLLEHVEEPFRHGEAWVELR